MKKEHPEMPEKESKVILYTTDDGKAQVSLMSRDGRVWLNQKQMAELFAVSKPNISMLIAKIFAENELDDSVVKPYLTTAADGKRYKVIYYALEMILAVGFRVRGVRGPSTRCWPRIFSMFCTYKDGKLTPQGRQMAELSHCKVWVVDIAGGGA